MKEQLKKGLDSLLKGIRTLAIVCNQWGDTGKGKFVDVFADWADVIVRGTGGANAGHTILLNGKEYIFHLVPSGILHDGDGKTNIIGSGTAFDPGIVCHELKILRQEGLSYNHLLISKDARLVLPQHLVMDRVTDMDTSGKIGTTGRGIGPVYEDHVARIGLTVNDLLNPDSFAAKLKRNLRDKVKLLKLVDPEVVKAIMLHEHLWNGLYWSKTSIFDSDAIVETYRVYGKVLGNMIRETDEYLRQIVGKKNILLEGAQGNLLDVDIGTYPFVTSSNPSVRGLAKGAGLRDRDIDRTLGMVKGFYMTRVGEGPFPTELGGNESRVWCGTKGANRESELAKFGVLSVNEADEFKQGIGIRMAGKEYGATTGRPRRVGWLDLPLLRHSIRHSGSEVILTKLDVLDGCQEIKICHTHEYVGEKYRLGESTLEKGARLLVAVMDNEVLRNCRPLYTSFPGWCKQIGGIETFEALPDELKTILCFVVDETEMRPRLLSVGAERDQTIVVAD